jgi:hypothetical protein
MRQDLLKKTIALGSIASLLFAASPTLAARSITLQLNKDVVTKNGDRTNGDAIGVNYAINDPQGAGYNYLFITKVTKMGGSTVDSSVYPIAILLNNSTANYGSPSYNSISDITSSFKLDPDAFMYPTSLTPGVYKFQIKNYVNSLDNLMYYYYNVLTVLNNPNSYPVNMESAAKWVTVMPKYTIDNFDLDTMSQANALLNSTVIRQDDVTTSGEKIRVVKRANVGIGNGITSASSSLLMGSNAKYLIPSGTTNVDSTDYIDADLLSAGTYKVGLSTIVKVGDKSKEYRAKNTFDLKVLANPITSSAKISDSSAAQDGNKSHNCKAITTSTAGDDKLLFKYTAKNLTKMTLQFTSGTTVVNFDVPKPNGTAKTVAIDVDCFPKVNAATSYSALIKYENTADYRKPDLSLTGSVTINP